MPLLAQLCGLAAFICCILVGIKGIQAKDTALGIISILCGIVAVVMVFTKQAQWGISNNLKFATVGLFAATVVLNILVVATARRHALTGELPTRQ